jgi:hypothetical protein
MVSGVGLNMNKSSYTIKDEWSVGLVGELFQRFRGSRESQARFEWLYLQNPAGAARVWVLYGQGGDPVGFTACFPRRMWVAGRPCIALVGGDFSIAPAHRTLGPAVLLRREAKALVDAGEFDLLYSHPLPAMLPVHARVGHPQLGELMRWTLPLRADHILATRLPNAAARLLTPPANVALAIHRWFGHTVSKASRRGGLELRRASEFSAEYETLDRALGQSYGVIGGRSPAYLAWRFLGNPTIDAFVVEAREGGQHLAGYVVLEHRGSATAVHDLAYVPGCGAEAALLRDAARRAVESGSSSLDIAVQRGFPGSGALASLGFWERDVANPTVCYGGKEFFGKPLVEDPQQWFMTVGDRDV